MTPANLGVKESVLVFTSLVVETSGGSAFLMTVLDRVVVFLVISDMWLYFYKVNTNAKNSIIDGR